jgi:hypothetical protein
LRLGELIAVYNALEGLVDLVEDRDPWMQITPWPSPHVDFTKNRDELFDRSRHKSLQICHHIARLAVSAVRAWDLQVQRPSSALR